MQFMWEIHTVRERRQFVHQVVTNSFSMQRGKILHCAGSRGSEEIAVVTGMSRRWSAWSLSPVAYIGVLKHHREPWAAAYSVLENQES